MSTLAKCLGSAAGLATLGCGVFAAWSLWFANDGAGVPLLPRGVAECWIRCFSWMFVIVCTALYLRAVSQKQPADRLRQLALFVGLSVLLAVVLASATFTFLR
jgi:hypothetical protein